MKNIWWCQIFCFPHISGDGNPKFTRSVKIYLLLNGSGAKGPFVGTLLEIRS